MDELVPPERLTTDRVVLRCWFPGDEAALSQAVARSREHLLPWMPWAEQPATEEHYRSVVRRFRAHWLLNQDFVLGIWDPQERRVLGGTGYHLRFGPVDTGVAEIGMWIHADEAGQGLGTHVLGALVDWAFDAWPWHRLVWTCDIDNHASRRVAEANDFRCEGVLRHDTRKAAGDAFRDTAVYARVKGR